VHRLLRILDMAVQTSNMLPHLHSHDVFSQHGQTRTLRWPRGSGVITTSIRLGV